MTMKKWMAAAAVLGMSAGAMADATYEFDSVTNLPHNGATVTGVLVNDTAPTAVTSGGVSGVCFDWLQLMMTDPGRFTVTITVTTSGGTFPGDPIFSHVSACRLNAKP